MRKFFRAVVNHPKLIFAVYAVGLVISAICYPKISVNYDINDYLPLSSPSTVALDVMEEEYGGGITNARVMVADVSVAEALEYKEALLAIEGVTEVTWLDDAVTIEEPLELQDTDTVETYYKDGYALFSVTIDEEYMVEACEAIRSLIGDENAMTGSVVITETATVSTVNEVAVIAAFGVAFALLVLILTTDSWAKPILILLGLGVAVFLNAGSNLIFGEISFVTNAAGSILQLAVSLDYSVFLMHRFEECRLRNPDPKEAMIEALVDSTSSILSSGLTTVISFLALCLMQFLIGPDLGLALAKGVALSLIMVFTLMPNIILVSYRLIDRTHHRALLPKFDGFAKVVRRLMIPMLAVFCIIVVPCRLASNANDFYYGASHVFGSDTQLGSDTEKIEEVFGKSDTYVLMVPKDSLATQQELSDALHELPEVTSIISYVDTVGAEIPESYLDEDTLSQLNSEHYTRMIISVSVDYEGEESFALVEEIRAIAEEYYPDSWYLAGQGVSTYDLMDTITADNLKVNLVAIAAVFLVLLFTMKSVSLPVILVLCIESAIWVNLTLPYFMGSHVFYIAYLLISSIQLGATVDYAILFTTRYLEFRETMHKGEAIQRTISSVFVSIMTSCSVLAVVGFAMGIVCTNGLISQLGYFLGVGALCSFLMVFFVLPGMLYVLDGVIQKTTRGLHFLKKVPSAGKKNSLDQKGDAKA